MKRIAFAWVTEWIDFTNKEEALRYANSERNKGHRVLNADGVYAYTREEVEQTVYENSNNEYKYTVRIEKPYKNYYMG